MCRPLRLFRRRIPQPEERLPVSRDQKAVILGNLESRQRGGDERQPCREVADHREARHHFAEFWLRSHLVKARANSRKKKSPPT